MNPLIIIGASGHGQVVADAVNCIASHLLLGFIDDSMAVGTVTPNGIVLGCCDDLINLLKVHPTAGIIIAIGDNSIRRRCMNRISSLCSQVVFPSVVHPKAIISADVLIGEGVVVLAGAIIGTGSKLGAFSIINTKASLDHHSTLGDFASLAPGVTTGGRVEIGAGAAVGLGACIMQGRMVGDDSVIGAMALIYHNIPARKIAYGQPAKVVSERDIDQPYLSNPNC